MIVHLIDTDVKKHIGTVIRDELGLTLDKADSSVLGHAAKMVLSKDSTTIVGDGSSQDAVEKRVAQIRNLIEVKTLDKKLFFTCISQIDKNFCS